MHNTLINYLHIWYIFHFSDEQVNFSLAIYDKEVFGNYHIFQLNAQSCNMMCEVTQGSFLDIPSDIPYLEHAEAHSSKCKQAYDWALSHKKVPESESVSYQKNDGRAWPCFVICWYDVSRCQQGQILKKIGVRPKEGLA